jgi:hypothetical protein
VGVRLSAVAGPSNGEGFALRAPGMYDVDVDSNWNPPALVPIVVVVGDLEVGLMGGLNAPPAVVAVVGDCCLDMREGRRIAGPAAPPPPRTNLFVGRDFPPPPPTVEALCGLGGYPVE